MWGVLTLDQVPLPHQRLAVDTGLGGKALLLGTEDTPPLAACRSLWPTEGRCLRGGSSPSPLPHPSPLTSSPGGGGPGAGSRAFRMMRHPQWWERPEEEAWTLDGVWVASKVG